MACTVATGCGNDGTIIECIGTSSPFVGTLVERHGNRAEFVIDKLPKRGASDLPHPHGGPPWKVGQRIRVHYIEGTGQYLKRGRQYSVRLFWLDNKVRSDVREADRPCSGGTSYADGSPIDTSFWIRERTRQAAVVVPLLAVATLLVVMVRRRRADRLRLAHLTKHSPHDWWAECLECGTWRSTGNATRQAAAQRFRHHQQYEHQGDPAHNA